MKIKKYGQSSLSVGSSSRYLCRAAFLLVWCVASAQADTLQQLISEAVSTHPSVRSQMSQYDAAQAGVDSARWQFYPTPTINVARASASDTDQSYQGDTYVTTFSLQQPLWTGGRLSAGLEGARSNVTASQAAVDETHQTISLQVVQAYGEWLSAFLKRQAWGKALAVHERLYEQVNRRAEVGVSAKSDLALAQGRLETTRADRAAVVAQEAVALSRLTQLVGRSLTSDDLASERAAPTLVQDNLDELQRLARLRSPAVRRALALVSTVDAEIDERKAAFLPEVSLRLEYQHGHFNFLDAKDESRIFVSFDSRFGAGLSSFSNVRAARMRREGAVADVAARHREINEQVIADYALKSSFKPRILSLQSSLKTASSVSESYGRQFLAGRKTWLDVMNAARDLVSTELQLVDAESSMLAVTWRLSILTQGVDQVLNQQPTASL